ncbi:MAG: hypothetical protein ACMG55_12425, partial [Microcoleus sp.]
IGSGSQEDMLIHHRFFASEESRQSWMKSFPDYEMPPREKPPYDRGLGKRKKEADASFIAINNFLAVGRGWYIYLSILFIQPMQVMI